MEKCYYLYGRDAVVINDLEILTLEHAKICVPNSKQKFCDVFSIESRL